MSQPSAPCATWESGAAVSHMFMDPHSSDSTCPKVIQRRDSTGVTRATASATNGYMARGPVWKSSGSSPMTRNWLKVNPSGVTSGIQVEMRWMSSAISVMVGCMGSMPRRRSGGWGSVQSGLNDPQVAHRSSPATGS